MKKYKKHLAALAALAGLVLVVNFTVAGAGLSGTHKVALSMSAEKEQALSTGHALSNAKTNQTFTNAKTNMTFFTNAKTNKSPSSATKTNVTYSYIKSNVSGGAWLRSCPKTSCAGVTWMQNGVQGVMFCWIDSQWVYPPNSNYASPRWFKFAPNYSNAIGYVHSSFVFNQRSVGHC